MQNCWTTVMTDKLRNTWNHMKIILAENRSEIQISINRFQYRLFRLWYTRYPQYYVTQLLYTHHWLSTVFFLFFSLVSKIPLDASWRLYPCTRTQFNFGVSVTYGKNHIIVIVIPTAEPTMNNIQWCPIQYLLMNCFVQVHYYELDYL